ncbi:hypothetical protein [Candidatus Albibeggiatoa sp. nov. NOAA]|uniref:hypothetical protein n=1 Tax=Candidatus Albibeggiatoa sp. nov. NOAA TaxID=3162724 RepID=UPI0032FE2132|nr:hypothetical protein [Thiotrichaceae bacterium]
MSQITIVTSIAPKNIDNQKLATESWAKCGFKVVSMNIKQEIKQLRSQFPHVTFHEAKRDARKEAGRPLVYIKDVLAYLQKHGTPVCGIVNSDIHFKAAPQIVDFLDKYAKGGVLFASRIDVDNLEKTAGRTWWRGMDTFFFDKQLIQHIPESKFCLGTPWWDLWFILAAFTKGIDIRYLTTPFAYHVIHQWNWDDKMAIDYGAHFVEFFGAKASSAQDLLNLAKKDEKQALGALQQITASSYNTIFLSKKTQWLAYDMYSDLLKQIEANQPS